MVDITHSILYNESCVERWGTNYSESASRIKGTGVWLSLARAPDLGSGGRRFESCHPD